MAVARTERPSRTTAISSSSLAEKSMPAAYCAPGVQAVRTAVPMRMASTRLSSQARPKSRASPASMTEAASVTARQSAKPGAIRRAKVVMDASTGRLLTRLMCAFAIVYSISIKSMYHST